MKTKITSVIAIIFVLMGLSANAQGTFVWAKDVGGTSTEKGKSIAADASGNAYVTGFFQGTVDFDPGPGVYTLTASSQNAFVTKFDITGTFLWAKSLGGPFGGSGNGITVDASGNVYTIGNFA